MNLNRLIATFRKPLGLPAEAQCKLCGFWNVAHPEVMEKMKAAGYSLESAVFTAQCKCGTNEEREAKAEEIEKVRKQWTGRSSRSDYHIQHARAIKDEDEERLRRSRGR